MIDHFNISFVVNGSRVVHHDHYGQDLFAVPKKLGIYREVDSGSDTTTQDIIERIISHRRVYETRNKQKIKKEVAASKALEQLKLTDDDSSDPVTIPK